MRSATAQSFRISDKETLEWPSSDPRVAASVNSRFGAVGRSDTLMKYQAFV